MSNVPRGRFNRLGFYKTRVARWAENAAAIGADPALVVRLQAATLDAQQALRDQRQAQQAARTATQHYNNAIARVASHGRALMLQIRCRAQTAGDGVCELAWISPLAKKSPIAAPGTPHTFSVDLLVTGALTLKWKCRNPKRAEGTQYFIHRRIRPSLATPAGDFAFLGSTGKKKFTDDTLPPGTAEATYLVQSIRSTATGPVGTFTVPLGGGRRVGAPCEPKVAA